MPNHLIAVLDRWTDLKTLAAYYEKELPVLNIPSGQRLFDELREHGERWNLLTHIPRLMDRPLLLIGASRDMDALPAYHHLPLVAALESAGAERLTHRVLDSDHYFSDRRILLARTILSWLKTQFPHIKFLNYNR